MNWSENVKKKKRKKKRKEEDKKITSRKAKDVMCFPSTVIWIPSDPTLSVATNG